MLKHSKKNIFKIIRSGFTLAEFFIVLMVISILCALVLPTMNQNANNQQFVTRFKKTYNELNQATEAIKYYNQGSLAGAVGTDSNSMRNAYIPYLNYINSCDAGSSGCFYAGSTSWHVLNGAAGWWDFTIRAQLVLKDGTFATFDFWSNSCTNALPFIRNGNPELCGYIVVDVNGNKGPNIMGRDIFVFDVTKYGLYPQGNQFDVIGVPSYSWTTECTTTSAGDAYNGDSCADRILEEGAMNY